jgi:hypothetical protein
MGRTEQIQWHYARCAAHLVRLRMLARDLPGAPVVSSVIQETTLATSAILAEAEAGFCAALTPAADGLHSSGNASLLATRLARLETAAENAVAAARQGDTAALRQHLRRFDALTTAIWTVWVSALTPARSPAPGRRMSAYPMSTGG